MTLPDSVGQLKHLRYLRLSGEIGSLPECLCRLQNLQTLDLWSCRGLRELPRCFSKLINLRHFHGGFNQLIDLPPRFGQLTSLQALDEFIVGESNGLDALGSFDHLAGHLRIRFEKCLGNGLSEAVAGNLKDKKLTELTLSWSSLYGEPAGDAKEEEDELAMKCLQPPPSLKSLSVLYWKGVRFPGWGMDEFPSFLPNLAHVLIRGFHRCERLLLLSQLPCLVSLHLWDLNTLEYIETSGDKREASSSAAYFPCLQFLKLQELPELKGWSRVEEEENFDHEQQIFYDENHQYLLLPPFFPRLSKLIMVNCPKLKSIPFAPMLEVLNADRIQGNLAKHILRTEEETESPMTLLPSSSALSTLTWMQISKVQELESLTINLKLESLTIRGCRDLISLFVESPTSLWRLEIIRCGRLRDISGALQHLAILQTLIIIDCEALEMGDIMDGDNDDGDDDGGRSINSKVGARSTVWQGLKSLHSLTLWNIPKLESHALQGLACFTALRELSIRDCPKLTALPESFCKLTSVQKLRIWRCPELERRCQGPNGQDWPLIQHIPYVRVVG